MDYRAILKKYDSFFGDEYDLENLSEEQIEEIIETENDLGKWLDSLLLSYKINSGRKKKYEKIEKTLKTLISWFMRRMEMDKYENDDAKVSTTFYFKYESDVSKVPTEYMMISWSRIQSALRKWLSVDGIVPTEKYPTRLIR